MQGCTVMTAKVEAAYEGPSKTLGDVLVSDSEVPEEYFVDEAKLAKWRYFKGGKSEPRVNKKTGFTYRYSEGAMAFPDPVDAPARTILTSEGGGRLLAANILLRFQAEGTVGWCQMNSISCRASRRAGPIPA